jgi:hypothetical protein
VQTLRIAEYPARFYGAGELRNERNRSFACRDRRLHMVCEERAEVGKAGKTPRFAREQGALRHGCVNIARRHRDAWPGYLDDVTSLDC